MKRRSQADVKVRLTKDGWQVFAVPGAGVGVDERHGEAGRLSAGVTVRLQCGLLMLHLHNRGYRSLVTDFIFFHRLLKCIIKTLTSALQRRFNPGTDQADGEASVS